MGGTRVLVVDDEAGLRMTLAANLELEGFDVVEASSAEQALEIAVKERPDLVVTDIRMPGMTGIDLFRELRRRAVEVPVVLMTAFALEELVQAALEEGAFAVLSKPFDVAHALRVLSNAAKAPVVLVIDDAEQVAHSTTAALNQMGVRAVAFTDGLKAVDALQAVPIDVCVVDMVMPGLSGPELVERLRAFEPSVAIIAVSGHDVPEMVRQVAQHGMHTFLSKPFKVQDLIRSVALARGARRTS